MSMSLLEFAAHISRAAIGLEPLIDDNLKKGCELFKDSAQTAIGTYRFNWPQLAPATLARKSGNTPLLETGALKDSIVFNVSRGEAYVGTDHFVAAWQEFGTRTIPPRPFMGGALNEKGPHVQAVFGKALAAKMLAP